MDLKEAYDHVFQDILWASAGVCGTWLTFKDYSIPVSLTEEQKENKEGFFHPV